MVGALLGASRISVFPRGPRLKSEDGDEDDSCPHLQRLVQALPTFYFREEDSMMNAVGELILLLFLLRSYSPLTSFFWGGCCTFPPHRCIWTAVPHSQNSCNSFPVSISHKLISFTAFTCKKNK